jgi:hypothetical protein
MLVPELNRLLGVVLVLTVWAGLISAQVSTPGKPEDDLAAKLCRRLAGSSAASVHPIDVKY